MSVSEIDLAFVSQIAAPVSEGIEASRDPSWGKDPLTVKCVRIVEETADARTFSFAGPDNLMFDEYLPGQFVTLNLMIEDKPVKRSYYISSSPTRPHLLEPEFGIRKGSMIRQNFSHQGFYLR
ncbi:MAG: hypothetical protein AAGG02_18880 [Cyanobacteria bacterium P01_H01_bin.15]